MYVIHYIHNMYIYIHLWYTGVLYINIYINIYIYIYINILNINI